MHKLKTRYLFYGSKVNLGSFGVIGVKFWFSLKMHYLFYVTKYIHVIHTLASHLQNKQGNWGQSGVDVSQPAGYAVCDGNMSSSFFLLSFFLLSFFLLSFFLATRLFHILLYIRFRPNLVKVTSTLTTTQAQMMMGSEVTMGSLGSKRSFSPKRHQVLQNA